MSNVTFQNDQNGNAVPQTQSGGEGSADVFVTGALNPLPMAGTDRSGNTRALSVNNDGGLSASYSQLVAILRPQNVTAYTAGDVVGGVIQIPNIGPAGGIVALLEQHLAPAISAIPTGMTSFRAYVYNRPPPSAIADNGVWVLPVSDLAAYQTYIDIGSPAVAGASGGSTLLAKSGPTGGEPAQLAPNSTSLWVYLVTNGGYTPGANGETYYLLTQAVAL